MSYELSGSATFYRTAFLLEDSTLHLDMSDMLFDQKL
jgi:hypothetical protein